MSVVQLRLASHSVCFAFKRILAIKTSSGVRVNNA
jgi:hypothetical protein